MPSPREQREARQLEVAHALAATISNDLACIDRPNPSPEALRKVAELRAATYEEDSND